MPASFFKTLNLSETKRAIPSLPSCGTCGLYKHCNSPKMELWGEGRKGILLIGEYPGRYEDSQGRPFVQESKNGRLIRNILRKFDVDADRDCWIYNSVICRPHHANNEGRIPTPKEIDYCRPNVINTIKQIKPNVIILLGPSAVKSVLGWLWKKDDIGLISRWDGWQIPSQQINSWVCPTWNPSYILDADYGSNKENDIRSMLLEKHIKAAIELETKPWETIPDYLSQVEIILDSNEAAKRIKELMNGTRPVAFDFETDGLKPDNKELGIYSCSLSDGRTTISYPWCGNAIEATARFLQSNVPKIGWNIKFELRWAWAKVCDEVNNLVWDGMLATHILDNRKDICSLKFQAFVQLGFGVYDDKVKPFLSAPTSNSKNRIWEADRQEALLYNGLDSLLEWKIAKIQAKKIGIKI